MVRAGDWWEHKIVPSVSAYYATAFVLGVPLASVWTGALVLVLSIVPGGAYVSLINDVTDRDADRVAGKPNRLAGTSPGLIVMLIGASVAAGLLFAWHWRDDPLLVSLYLAAGLAFSLYSLPPFRFKERGLAGVICDAAGAHLLPALVAVLAASRTAGRPVDVAWLASIGVWAFAFGLRGILWHQLTDRDNDRRAGVGTFAQRHPPRVAARLGTFLAFPLELAALAAMLWRVGSPWPPVLLAAQLALAGQRMRRWALHPMIVAPQPRSFFVLQEYYAVFWPVALLVASAVRNPIDLTVAAAHLLVFPLGVLHTLGDLRMGLRRALRLTGPRG